MKLSVKIAEILLIGEEKLTIAESFTGGTICADITQIPGISKVFTEGIVCYSNLSKQNRLGVNKATINDFGAVSRETAHEMLCGIKTHYGIVTTGNAGPTSEKHDDNGHCFIGIKVGNNFHVNEYYFCGSRVEVIEQGKNTALELFYEQIKNS